MSKEVIRSPEVAEVKGISLATRVGDRLYLSGMVARDREGKVVGVGDVAAQARRCFEAIKALVEAAGGTLDDVVKVNTYLTRIGDAAAIRPAREAFFKPPYPAWTTVAISALINPDFLIEVDAVAALGRSDRGAPEHGAGSHRS